MFFRKSKMKKINQANKTAIIGTIEGLRQRCHSEELRKELYTLSENYKSQPVNPSEELFENDAKMIAYLRHLNEDITQEFYRVAAIRMQKLKLISAVRGQSASASDDFSARSDRRAADAAKKKVDRFLKKNALEDAAANFKTEDLYAADDLFQITLASQQDVYSRELETYKTLQEKLERNPDDFSIISDMEVCEEKIKGYEELMQIYRDERNHQTFKNTIEKISAERKKLLAERPYGKEAMDMLLEEYEKNKKDYDESTMTREKWEARKKEQGSEKGTYVSGAAAGAGSRSGALNEGFKSTGNSTVDRIKRENFLKKQHEKLKEAMKQADRNVERLNDRLQECGDDLKEIDQELTPLLKQRRELSASRRLALDSQIDVLNARRNGKVREMKEINQRISINTSQRGVFGEMERKYARREEEKEGIFSMEEIQEMAQEVDAIVKTYNQALEDANDAYIVAQGTDIEWGSAGGTSQVESSGDYSDDNKYSALEKEIGLEFPAKN